MYRISVYRFSCFPVLSSITRYVGSEKNVCEIWRCWYCDACLDWWRYCGRGNFLPTISRIGIRYVYVLWFGELGLTRSEHNTIQSVAYVVGNYQNSRLVASSTRAAFLFSFLRYTWSPRRHHAVFFGLVGVLKVHFSDKTMLVSFDAVKKVLDILQQCLNRGRCD